MDMTPELVRLRTAMVTVAMFVTAAAAGGVFDRLIWALSIPVALPTAVSLLLPRRHPVVRTAGHAGAVVGGVAIVVVVSGGGFTAVLDAFTGGAQGLLTTDWPSPDQADLIGTMALLVGATTALSSELACRPRWHLLPLAPIIVADVVVIALSAPLGARLYWLMPLAILFASFATLRPGAGLAERWTLLRGERRLIPLVLAALAAGAIVSVPVAWATRANPRRNEPATQTATLLDPIEATLALQALDPPIVVNEIIADSPTPLPTRWRTAALSSYDGQRWAPTLTLRPIGRRLGPDADDAITFEVQFVDDDSALVPLPGVPITIDARLETDADRTIVRLSERIDADVRVTVSSRRAPNGNDAIESGIGTRAVDESVSGLTEFATGLAGNGPVLTQLRQIERTLKEEFLLEPGVAGGGLQRALIERFLRDTQRGTAEQFATSYVLLVRSLGIDARVATGFLAEVQPAGGVLTLTSSDAAVWPEVRLLSGEWLAFDPVPDIATSEEAPPPEQPAVQTPAAAQPPIAPPPEPSADNQADDNNTSDAPATTLSAVARWARRAGVLISAFLLPTLAVMAIILGVKRRRRRRLLGNGSAAERVVGAWAVATDRLVDAGLTVNASATNGDIAALGRPLAPGANRELHRLSTLSSAVTFGTPARTDLMADDASSSLSHLETSMAAARTRSERLRWRLSLRSLRRSTRSPVHR